MKRINLLLVIMCLMALISCGSTACLPSPIGSCYKVYKIERNNEYYEIYAFKPVQDFLHYKIVSEIDRSAKGTRIRVGGCYKFELTSMRESSPVINGIKLDPVNYLDMQYMHPKKTAIKIDGGKIHDLHYAKNLKGLYLIKN